MPNWVKTIVKTNQDVMQDVLKKYSSKEIFSFNKVIPMPKDLEVEKSSRGEDGLMYLFLENNEGISKEKINTVYRSLNPFHSDIYREAKFQKLAEKYDENKDNLEYKESIDLAKKYISNYEKYGHADWYEWCCDKWGTKWDLSSFAHNKDTMIFETAWGFAGNIILELSRKYPEAVFDCRFADEGIQENSGILKIKDGEILEEKYNLNQNSINEIWDYYIEEKPLENTVQNSSSLDKETEIEIEY